MTITTLTEGPSPRRRGKTKAGANWKCEGDISVIALDLDVSGVPETRQRLEKQWAAAFALERAIKSDAAHRTAAFDAWRGGRKFQSLSKSERGKAASAMREQLGLTPKGLESSAYRHIENAGWLRDHVTKAQACHHAAAVWATTKRHLFPDSSGNFFGPPSVGSWWDFTRMVGRAKSHTKNPPVWETFRLVGSLDAHMRAYLSNTPGVSTMSQPGALSSPLSPTKREGGWWFYQGPLAVVFTGLKAGDLILPVRLPSGVGTLARLNYFLADSSAWHKIDLIRIRDRKAPGGWRYQAHLAVLKPGYQAPSTIARRQDVDEYRLAGIDANVGNLAAVSMPGPTMKALDNNSLRVTVITPSAQVEARAEQAARALAHASARLDRSRRTSNPDQYAPSKKQQAREQRRAEHGLTQRKIDTPGGKRVSNSRGFPKQAYRKDTLTPAYRRTRADKAALQASTAARKDAVARQTAIDLVNEHGNRWVAEDVSITPWMRLWGKRLSVTTPGRIMTHLTREITATGGAIDRAGTRETWLSQRCVCGRREKKPLSKRWHSCPDCGLQADRDVLAAALATTITFTDKNNPSTARVDPTLVGVLTRRIMAHQEGPVRSTITLTAPPSGGDSSTHPRASAGRNDSTSQPLSRQTRKGPPRRRRKGRTPASTPVLQE
jgi:hypothetical protein